MSTRRPSWKTIVRKQIGRAATYGGGDGPFAFVTPCRQPYFTLWGSRQEAAKCKTKVDKVGCGGECTPRRHYIIDLSTANVRD